MQHAKNLGQSVANSAMGVSLFGGFTDEFVRVDEFTGRVDRLPALGTTVLFPWDDSLFLAVENMLGRPAQVTLSLRDVVEPTQPVAVVASRDLPAAAGAVWGSDRLLIPGLHPTIYGLGGGRADESLVARNGAATASFVAGIFRSEAPVIEDGRIGTLEVAAAVGRDDRAWIANAAGLVALEAERRTAVTAPEPWRPHAIDYDPASDRVVVSSWNRFRSQRGPSSDIYVFTASGDLVGIGRVDALVDRMALHDDHVTTYDVTGNVGSSVVSEP